MNKPAHTPGPWHVTGSPYRADLGKIEAGDQLVASAYADHLMPAAIQANARRIVACVNACAGIPTEALESGALAALMQAIGPTKGSASLAAIRAAIAKLRGEG